MASPDCPARGELTDYALGRVPDDRSGTIAEHLNTCATCQETLLACGSEPDSLVATLRQAPASDPYAAEAGCREAMALVEAIGRDPSTGGGAAVAAPSETADLGQLGQYKLLAKVGEGGMGAVYKALHTRLDKVVAVKVLPQERTRNPHAVARFEREMKAVGRLEHPNIVRAMDANEEEGTHYLVMEYVEGIDLSKLVHRCGPLPIPDACELVRQAALGLQYADEHGLVHRDIKPSNLMLSLPSPVRGRGVGGEGRQRSAEEGSREGGKLIAESCSLKASVKILDLGLALLGADQPAGKEMTGTGQAMGTADYMAPEQAVDSHNVDIRADIYALGCTLYKLLTGHAPFSDPRHKSNLEKLMAHMQEPVPSVQLLRADVPDALAALLSRMLAKTPDERPATPAEVVEVIEPFSADADLLALAKRAQKSAEETREPERSRGSTEPYPSSALVGTATSDLAKSPLPVWERITKGPLSLWERVRVRASRHRTPVKVAIATMFLGFGIVAALGIMISIRTQQGTLTIETDDPGVQVAVKQGGDLVEVVDAQNNWTIRLKEGEYELEVRGGSDKLALDRDTLTVTRGDQIKARVILKRARDAGRATEDAPVMAGKPADPAPRLPAQWQEPWRKVEAAYDANRFDEALRLYDALLAGMTQEREKTGNTQLDPAIDLIRKRQSLVRFIIDRGKLPVEKQVELTKAELAELNPEYNETKARFGISDGKITAADLNECGLRDLGPLKGLPLESLQCSQNSIVDLSPLKGMRLKSLRCNKTRVKDITPLRGMPLEELLLSWTQVKDISALAGMPLLSLHLIETGVSDISSLAGMPLRGLHLDSTPVRDITVLQGMPLKTLSLQDTLVSDISVLKGMPLQSLQINRTGVRDISVLEGMPLTFLYVHETPVADISALQGMPLKTLLIHTTNVTDLTPLADAPLETLGLAPEKTTKGMDAIRAIKSLKTINSKPASEFWKEFDAVTKRRDARLKADAAYDANRFDEALRLYDALLAGITQEREKTGQTQLDPAIDLIRKRQSLVRFIIDRGKLPAEKQVELTQAKLAELNPNCSKGSFKISDGKITDANLNECGLPDVGPLKGLPLSLLECQGNGIVDLSPLKGMVSLRGLHCAGNPIADLSPLKGMRLTGLNLYQTRVKDITPLRGMPLQGLHLGRLQIRDISVLAGMPLSYLILRGTGVSDISSLAGMPLTTLDLRETGVSDISSLAGMPLTDLSLLSTLVRDIVALKGMPLRSLWINNTAVRDISVLKGMPLQSLWMNDTGVTDISVLEGMPLQDLRIGGTPVRDISVLKKIPLTLLDLYGTPVADISPLRGMPLKTLKIHSTKVTDLTPLAGAPLETLSLGPENITKGMDAIRAIKSLKTINSKPAAEFWKEFDASAKQRHARRQADAKADRGKPKAEPKPEAEKPKAAGPASGKGEAP